MIKHDLENMTLNIYKSHLIVKTVQGFNDNVKSLINFNTPATPHKGIIINQEKCTNIKNIYIRYTGAV